MMVPSAVGDCCRFSLWATAVDEPNLPTDGLAPLSPGLISRQAHLRRPCC